jgi:hypothetical protein
VLETLAPNDFSSLKINCGDWYNCIEDEFGRNIGDTEAVAAADDVTWLPAQQRLPYAAAILLDLGEQLRIFDPERRTMAAMKLFATSVTSADSLALATFQEGSGPLKIRNEFTTDTAAIGALIDRLPGLERGRSPLHAATQSMLDFVVRSAPRHVAARQRALIVPAWNHQGSDCGSGQAVGCVDSGRALTKAATSSDIRLIAIGGTWANDAALHSGGVSIELSGVHQLPAVARALDAIASRSLPRHRVRMTLKASSGSFVQGSTAVFFPRIRIAADDAREVTASVRVTF